MAARAKSQRRRPGPSLATVLLAVLAVGAVAPVGAAPAATAGDLGWMAGCWGSMDEGGSEEECWLAPGGGMLLGVHRDVSPRRSSFEFLRIADEGEGLTLFASPGGASPTPFRLVELGARRAVFANPEHDFPQRVLYWREGDRLRARVDAEVAGETKALEFSWERTSGGW
jgi:hypothetical protein